MELKNRRDLKKMKCVIENIDFYNLEAEKYYAPPSTWGEEKKKDNATNKIFSLDWVGAQKRDGTFAMCGKTPDGELFLRPRAKNVKGEFANKVDWVPQFHDVLNALDPGTVLLGEVYLPRDEQAKTTTSILNCLLKKSLDRQKKEEDKLHLYVFDILAENGKSYLKLEAEKRFDKLNDFRQIYQSPYVEWAKYYEGQELWNMLQDLLAEGYEGMVIIKKDSFYEPGKRSAKVSLKIKKELQETIDCFVIGANPPSQLYDGKEIGSWPYWYDDRIDQKINAISYFSENHRSIYSDYVDGVPVVPVTRNWFYGWAGSLKLGAYKDKRVIHIGNLSGVTDEVKEHWDEYVGRVCEISAMEVMSNQDGGFGLRHPKLVRWRDDIDKTECTWERIFGS